MTPYPFEKADYILDFGPQAGEHGGHITAKGTLNEILKNPNSLTGAYLSGKKSIPIPEKRRKASKGKISIKNASIHNLKNIHVDIPVKLLTCLTGVSGSGKSTLLHDLLLPACQKGINDKDLIHL